MARNWTMAIDTDLGALLEDLEVDRPLLASMKRRLGNVYNRAGRVWPVRSGFSQNSLYFRGPIVRGPEIVVELGCEAWYALVIPSQPGQDLLMKPTDHGTDLILRDTADLWGT